jgi:hypothetical protein
VQLGHQNEQHGFHTFTSTALNQAVGMAGARTGKISEAILDMYSRHPMPGGM